MAELTLLDFKERACLESTIPDIIFLPKLRYKSRSNAHAPQYEEGEEPHCPIYGKQNVPSYQSEENSVFEYDPWSAVRVSRTIEQCKDGSLNHFLRHFANAAAHPM